MHLSNGFSSETHPEGICSGFWHRQRDTRGSEEPVRPRRALGPGHTSLQRLRRVSVGAGCSNRTQQTGQLTQQTPTAHSAGDWEVPGRGASLLGSGENPFLAFKWFPSCCVLTRHRKRESDMDWWPLVHARLGREPET